MDYTQFVGNNKLLIEEEQKRVREDFIAQYKEIRKKEKVTQVELSKRTGISQPNVTRFESGRYNPTLEMMVRMASALNLEVKIELVKKK